jgi:hypothetical protein
LGGGINRCGGSRRSLLRDPFSLLLVVRVHLSSVAFVIVIVVIITITVILLLLLDSTTHHVSVEHAAAAAAVLLPIEAAVEVTVRVLLHALARWTMMIIITMIIIIIIIIITIHG